MAIGTHFLHSGHSKSNLYEFAEVIISVGEWHRGLIIFLLDFLKNDFGEVDETMFQGVDMDKVA
jgi:hypothetical protein